MLRIQILNTLDLWNVCPKKSVANIGRANGTKLLLGGIIATLFRTSNTLFPTKILVLHRVPFEVNKPHSLAFREVLHANFCFNPFIVS